MLKKVVMNFKTIYWTTKIYKET